MHEFSMTSMLVNKVLEEANKKNAKRVLEVVFFIGKLSFLGIEQVKFSYKVLIKDTIMDHSKLIIKEREGKVECEKCGYKGQISLEEDTIYHLMIPNLSCPECGSAVKIIDGKECIIKKIKIII